MPRERTEHKVWVVERKDRPGEDLWRVVVVYVDGRRITEQVRGKAAARDRAAELRAKLSRLSEIRVTEAIDKYRAHMLANDLREISAVNERHALRAMFEPVMTQRLSTITARQAKELYLGRYEGEKLVAHGLVTRPVVRPGPGGTKLVSGPRTVDTHRNALGVTKYFMDWCVSQGWIGSNPFREVKGVGKRRKGGKGQTVLTEKEIRAYAREATKQAEAGSDRALAALFPLVFGMRCSEIVSRRVRHLDEEEWVLEIKDDRSRDAEPEQESPPGRTRRRYRTKTAAARRKLPVPEFLRPLLARQIAERRGDEYLFGEGENPRNRKWVRDNVAAICAAAKIPYETAHGLRGAHNDMAQLSGETPEAVARALGHERVSTTAQHYTSEIGSEAASRAKQGRVIGRLKVLSGGVG